MNSALSIAVALALVCAVVAEDMCQATENPVYEMGMLPYGCHEDFATCSSAMCECIGMTFDSESKECKQATSAPECASVATCLGTYVNCVNNQYVAASENGAAANCTDQGDEAKFNFFHSQALQIVINDNYNTSELFQSCGSFVCGVANVSRCELTQGDICNPPSITVPITMVPGSTPYPTNPDGSYAVATKLITLLLSFAGGNFDTLVGTKEGRDDILRIMTEALTKKLSYTTKAKKLKYTSASGVVTEQRRKNLALAESNLDVNAEASIPADDTSTLNSVLANVNSLKSDTSTTWLSALSTACGCTIPVPSVTATVTTVAAPSTPTSTKSACSTGCIAGVVIGGTAAVAIGVGAVAYVSMKKSAAVAPDGSK